MVVNKTDWTQLSILCHDQSMTNRDEAVGRAVAAARGTFTQQAVALEMRHRGNAWTPTTIAKVERGERQLRYVEALDLAAILDAEVGVFGVDALEGERLAELRRLVRYAEDRWRAGGQAWREYSAAAEAVRAALEGLDVDLDDEEELYIVAVAKAVLDRQPEELVDMGWTYPAGPGDGQR